MVFNRQKSVWQSHAEANERPGDCSEAKSVQACSCRKSLTRTAGASGRASRCEASGTKGANVSPLRGPDTVPVTLLPICPGGLKSQHPRSRVDCEWSDGI